MKNAFVAFHTLRYSLGFLLGNKFHVIAAVLYQFSIGSNVRNFFSIHYIS